MKHRLIGKCNNGILSGLLGHEQSQRVYHIFDMQKEFVVHPIINFPLTSEGFLELFLEVFLEVFF